MSMSDMAADVSSFMEHHGLYSAQNQSCALMGHSLGAAVTMQLLSDRHMEHKIDRCVLVDFGAKQNIYS